VARKEVGSGCGGGGRWTEQSTHTIGDVGICMRSEEERVSNCAYFSPSFYAYLASLILVNMG